jgi:8-oxo-dGTP pyrophosphatase MutT (NUDIX family)
MIVFPLNHCSTFARIEVKEKSLRTNIVKTTMRVAGIWIAKEHILLESLIELDRWGIPGGGLEPDETVEAGCIREYQEEIGIEMRCKSMAIIHEHFWIDTHETSIREYGFYFIVEPTDSTIDAPLPIESLEGGMKFRWFPIDALKSLDFVPRTLKQSIARLSEDTVFLSTTD